MSGLRHLPAPFTYEVKAYRLGSNGQPDVLITTVSAYTPNGYMGEAFAAVRREHPELSAYSLVI